MNNTAPPSDGGTLLTLPETAQRLRVGKTTIHKLVSEGLPVIEVGSRRCLRVSPSALAAWLAARSTDAARTEAGHVG